MNKNIYHNTSTERDGHRCKLSFRPSLPSYQSTSHTLTHLQTVRPEKLLILACETDALDPLHTALEAIRSSHPSTTASDDESKDEAIADFINRATDPLGVPAIHVAVRHGSTEVIDEMTEYPINVDTLDRDRNSILHAAVKLTEHNFPAGDHLTRLFLEAGTPIL